jgi:hypothetical protein
MDPNRARVGVGLSANVQSLLTADWIGVKPDDQ